jgi:hypothetical protein
LGLAAVATVGFSIWLQYYGGAGFVDATLKGNRSCVYSALVSVFGSLLGFAITAVSIMIGFAGLDRLAVIRESKQYPALWKVFAAAIKALGMATVAALFGLIVDHDAAPVRTVLYFCILTATLAVLRVYRCIWALDKVICLVIAPSKARSGDKS